MRRLSDRFVAPKVVVIGFVALGFVALASTVAPTAAGAGKAPPTTTTTTVPTTTTTAVPPLDPRVFVVGDSVMLGAQSAIGFRLGVSGWLVAQHEAESLHTYEVPGIIGGARAAGGVGEVVVVAMGANDGSDPGQFASWIDGVLANAQDVRRVYWVNMRHFRAWVPAANAQIDAAAARWANMRVIDWAARSQNEPGLVAGDGLHLTDAGKQALAEQVGQALDQYRVERTAAPAVPVPPVVPAAPAPTVPEVAPQRVIRDQTSESGIVLWIAAGAAALVALGSAAVLLGRSRRVRSL